MDRRLAALAVLLLLVIASALLAAGARPSSPAIASASPSSSAEPSPISSPATTASASPSPSPGIRVTAVGTLPADPHFFAIGTQEVTRILLFDSASTRAPVEIVRFDPSPAAASGPDVRTVTFGASADGQLLIVVRRFSEQRSLHYLVRPQTGELRVLIEDLTATFTTPVVSPDGSHYAYARWGDPAETGVWIADARENPAPRRLIASDPQWAGSPPQPLAWSSDGASLAVVVSDDSGGRIGVVKVRAGETTFDPQRDEFTGGNAKLIGPGVGLDWRGGDRSVLVTSSRNAFGGRSFIYVVDLVTGKARDVYAPARDVVLSRAEWHPSLDRFLVHERAFCCGPDAQASVWIRKPDGSGTKVIESPLVGVPWWSKDGTRLWAPVGGDDATGTIRDPLSTAAVAFCLRSAGPPPCV